MKTIPLDNDVVDWPRIQGPVWHDCCEHEKESYVCSFQIISRDMKSSYKYDLYLFQQSIGESVCIRFGNEGHEYYSYSTLGSFLSIKAEHSCHISVAQQILHEHGKFTWNVKEK